MATVIGGPVDSHVQRFADDLKEAIPEIQHISTYGDHSPSRELALDIFASKEVGDRVVEFVIRNYKLYGVWYQIWRRHIWNPKIQNGRWRDQGPQGSWTADHMDHVHVSFYADAPILTTITEKGFLDMLTEDQQKETYNTIKFVGTILQEWKETILAGGDGDYAKGLDRLVAAMKRSNPVV